MRSQACAVLFTLTLALTGVATAQPTASLYERLGGRVALTAVVDDFVARVAADDRINQNFARTDIPRVKAMLVEQICEATAVG